MAKTECTLILEQKLFERLGRTEFGCKEVTLGWYGHEIVDFMTYSIDKKREIRCFEIKVSKSDFRSKSKLTFIGHYNYFVMPIELYHQVKDEIRKEHAGIGVYVLDGDDFYVIEKPRFRELKADKEVILSSLARSMQREWFKVLKEVEKMKNDNG